MYAHLCRADVENPNKRIWKAKIFWKAKISLKSRYFCVSFSMMQSWQRTT
jgi:hypothetical protein